MICLLTKITKNIFCQVAAVNKISYIRFVFFILIFLNCKFSVLAQQEEAQEKVHLNKIVSISFPGNSFKDFLSILSAEYQLNFSYINNEIPLQKQVQYTAKNKTLKNVLDSVCKQVSVQYYIIGTQIVLKSVQVPEPIAADSLHNMPLTDTLKIKVLPADTVLISNGHHFTKGSYKTNKDYKKYFLSVYGKHKAPDSVIVETTIAADSSLPKKITRKYVYANRKYLQHLKNNRTIRELFSISVFAGPGVSYRTVTSSEWLVTDRNKTESSVGNICGGLYISYFTDPHISLRTGVSYLNFGEKGAYSDTYIDYSTTSNNQQGNPNQPSVPGAPVYKTIYHTYKNQYNYITIPLMVGYTFDVSRKFHVSVYSGMAIAFFLKMKSTYSDSAASMVSSLNITRNPYAHTYSKTSIVLPIQIDIGYQLNKKMQLFFMPGYNYFLTSIYTKDDVCKEKPYAFNFSVGIRYMFDRH